MISSEGDILVAREDGTKTWAESMTKLFVSKQDCIDYAVTEMKKAFAAYDFEDGEDENGETEDDFELDLKKGEDICIQACSSHICFEYFVQDLGTNIINRDDYFAAKLWSDEDLEQELIEKGYAGTPEQVAVLINSGFLKGIGDCTDSEWEQIHYAIYNTADELKKSNPDWIVSDIEWDVEEEDPDSKSELPDTVRIPFSECDRDDIADHLSDAYGFCISSYNVSYEGYEDEAA